MPFTVIISRRKILLEYAAHKGDMRNDYTVLVRKPHGKKRLEDQGVDGGQ
jgi:hypothetical protein